MRRLLGRYRDAGSPLPVVASLIIDGRGILALHFAYQECLARQPNLQRHPVDFGCALKSVIFFDYPRVASPITRQASRQKTGKPINDYN
jgi:hypothetical protein